MTHTSDSVESMICENTGFALVRSPAAPTFRIAQSKHGPLNPLIRVAGNRQRTTWGRFDAVGRTIYSADDRVTAYLELLAPYRLEIEGERRGIQSLAERVGESPELLWSRVLADWDQSGYGDFPWLPTSFRAGRVVYAISYPDGWWIDMSHRATVSSLIALGRTWPRFNGRYISALTMSNIVGDDRMLTTSIATYLRDKVQLGDASQPLGIRYISKYGSSSAEQDYCWAYWLRDEDGPSSLPNVDDRKPITADDPDFLAAQKLCGIVFR